MKNKILISCLLLLSCNRGNYSVSGMVHKIEWGKDGYNAILITENGDSVSATISKVNMGLRYMELKVGEKVKIYGDSLQFENEIHITATKIVE